MSSDEATPHPRVASKLALSSLILVVFSICCLSVGLILLWNMPPSGGPEVVVVTGEPIRPPPRAPLVSGESVFAGSLALSVLTTLGAIVLAIVAAARSKREGNAGCAVSAVSIGLCVLQIIAFSVIGLMAWFLSLNIHL